MNPHTGWPFRCPTVPPMAPVASATVIIQGCIVPHLPFAPAVWTRTGPGWLAGRLNRDPAMLRAERHPDDPDRPAEQE